MRDISSAPAASAAISSLPVAPPRSSALAIEVGMVTGPRWPEPTAVVSSKLRAWAMPPFTVAAATAGSFSANPMSVHCGAPPAARAHASSCGMPTPSVFAASVVANVSSASRRTVARTSSGRSS